MLEFKLFYLFYLLLFTIELFEQYHGVVDFTVLQSSLLRSVESLILSLPTSVGSSNRPPALLRLIHSMSKFKESIATVCEQESWMVAIIACLACRVDPTVMKMVMDIVTAIFDRDQGSSLLPYSQVP